MTTARPTADLADARFEAGCADRRARFRAVRDEHIARLSWGSRRLAGHQRHRLRVLLAHAIERSPFHAARLRGVDPATFQLHDLASLPVMTKTEMMADFDAVVTDPRLTRRTVETHLASLRDRPEFLLGDYTCLASSGISGERGIFVYDADAIVDLLAGNARRPVAALLGSGGPPPGGARMAIVGARSPIHATSAIGAIFSDPSLFSVTAVPATLPLPEIVARLNLLQPSVLLGYPSVLALLAAQQHDRRLAIAPAAVTSVSETLAPETRRRVGHAFGVPVADNFGSSEGLVGVSEPGDDPIVFASDLAIVEPVDDDGHPVPEGAPSTRVLVTNLFNLTQPLIRYELQDRFVRWPAATGHGHLRATVQGRTTQLLHWGPVTVHPHTIGSELLRHPAVVDYQLRRTDHGIDVTVIAAHPTDTGRLAARLARALDRAGLRAPAVTVTQADALARHPQSGKRL
jgi:phenylacetate-CoA ligase